LQLARLNPIHGVCAGVFEELCAEYAMPFTAFATPFCVLMHMHFEQYCCYATGSELLQ
jgi:hypothetical protein